MDISLRQLEAFIKVAEHRSFSKAGDELFLSQSTISSHVAQLEQSLQVTLIKRREKKNIELTEEGQRAYRAAQIIINQAEMLQNMFRKEEADQPLISIAASTVPSSYILPGIMTGFSDIRPECRFSVLDDTEAAGRLLSSPVGSLTPALERLQNGEAVFAFVGTSSRKTIFSYHTVCRDRMVLITPNNKEFAEKKEMGVLGKELLEWPMIMRESGSGTRRETDNYLKSIGMSSADLNVAGYMNNIEGIKSMVAAGKGTTILSERAAADAIRDGRVLCFDLEEDGPYRDIYIAYLKNRSFTQTEQAFLNYVRNRSGEKPKQNKNNKKLLKEE